MKAIKQDNIWSITSFLENKEHNFDKEKILNHLPINLIDEAVNITFLYFRISYALAPS